eukprot:2065770-Rhodomonas_salina.1
MPLHRCSGDSISATPFFNSAKDCLYTFSDVQSSSVYYMSMQSLAVVPCAIVKPTRALCSVVDDAGVFVVGFELMDSLSG